MKLNNSDIETIVDRAVDQTLTKIGLFTDDPKEMQGMMHYLRNEYKTDRKIKSDIRSKLISFSIPPLMLALWEGMRHTFSK